MAEIGAFLSSEEHGPAALVAQAKMAEEAGITLCAIARSDGFEIFTHPRRIEFESPAKESVRVVVA